MTAPYSNSSTPPCAARLGRKGMAVPVEATDPERHRDLPHTDLSVGTAAASKDAPVSDVAGFSEDLIITRAQRLALLTDAHLARKRHASTKALMAKLRRVTARLAMIGG